MVADNVKKLFVYTVGLKKTLQKFIWQHQQEQQHQKNINQQQQNINQFNSEGVSKYTQEKTCAEVSF